MNTVPLEKNKSLAHSVFSFLWLMTGVMVATARPLGNFVMLEFGSSEYWVILVAYVITGLPVLLQKRSFTWLRWPHLILLLFIFLLRPCSFLFGRHGYVFILLLYIPYFTFVSGILRARQYPYALLLSSSLAALLLLNFGLQIISTNQQLALKRTALLDYGDVIGQDNLGGFLRAGLNREWIGEFPKSFIVTDEYGFRVEHKTSPEKPSGVLRIVFVGDSFVVGIRTDQSQTIGKRLESELAKRLGLKVEILIAGSDNPLRAVKLIDAITSRFQPDWILLGLTLGNDFTSAYLDRRNLNINSEKIVPKYLPKDAYNLAMLRSWAIKLDRTLQQWEIYKFFRRTFRPEGIFSLNNDYPGRVSIFDFSSGLAYYYNSQEIDVISDSINDVEYYLERIQEQCTQRRVKFAVVLFPQRFQVTQGEWDAAMFDYGLDEKAFDSLKPNRLVLDFCKKSRLLCVDPTEYLRSLYGNFYFPQGDMHFNANGQAALADYLAQELDWIKKKNQSQL